MFSYENYEFFVKLKNVFLLLTDFLGGFCQHLILPKILTKLEPRPT